MKAEHCRSFGLIPFPTSDFSTRFHTFELEPYQETVVSCEDDQAFVAVADFPCASFICIRS